MISQAVAPWPNQGRSAMRLRFTAQSSNRIESPRRSCSSSQPRPSAEIAAAATMTHPSAVPIASLARRPPAHRAISVALSRTQARYDGRAPRLPVALIRAQSGAWQASSSAARALVLLNVADRPIRPIAPMIIAVRVALA